MSAWKAHTDRSTIDRITLCNGYGISWGQFVRAVDLSLENSIPGEGPDHFQEAVLQLLLEILNRF